MTAPIDIVNRALGECGARMTLSSLTDNGPVAVAANLNYTPLRQQLLRAAHWGFARKTAPMTLLGSQYATPVPTSPVPWAFKYAYPSDCLAVRYVLPPPPAQTNVTVPPTGLQFYVPWCPPSRNFRFISAYDDTGVPPQKVILTNVGLNGSAGGPLGGGLVVYTVDVTNPDLWDSLFEDAMVMGLANKLAIPASGNIKMKGQFVQMAKMAVDAARVADGNEAIPTVDFTPAWISARGVGSPFGYGPEGGYGYTGMGAGYGDWFGAPANLNWGS